MVVALFALVLGQASLPDRAMFFKELENVSTGMPIAEVRQRLGPPDDVCTQANSDAEKGVTVFRYGTNGHDTFATLGEVVFRDGKVCWPTPHRYLPPPSTKIVSEAELRALIHKLYRPEFPYRPSDDPLWLIQAGNALIEAGKDKAIAAIQEFDQITLNGPHDGIAYGCHWLLRTMFEPPTDPGYFPCPQVGSYFIPEDRLNSPRHPIILFDDIPFSIFTGAMLRGVAEPVSRDAEFFRTNCRLRSTPLLPPDDPFLSYRKMIKSRLWPYPPFDPQTKTRFTIPYAEDEGIALKSLLYLVRTAYRTPEMGTYDSGYINGLDFDKFHRDFLATGAKWDPIQQMYVPKNARILVDDNRQFRRVHLTLQNGGVKLVLTLQRKNTEDVSFWSDQQEDPNRKYFLVMRDGESKEPLNLGSPIDESKLKVLRLAALDKAKRDNPFGISNGGIALKEGHPLIIEFWTSDQSCQVKTIKL